MAEDFSVRLRLPNEISKGDIVEVKAKIKHPSSTGLGFDTEAARPFDRFFRDKPAEYVRLVEVYYAGERISLFEMNSSSSNDPLLAFKLRADTEGQLRVVVTNHRRETVEATADVQFA